MGMLSNRSIRKRLRRSWRAWSGDLATRLPSATELAQIPVEISSDGKTPGAGSRPQRVVRDALGRRYFFKSAPPEQIAAELLSFRIRSAGGRPCIPTAHRELDLPGAGRTHGLIQPILEHRGGCLPLDTSRWTPIQIEAMQQEYPWEWVLGNADTHLDQYLLLGEDHVPLNIDWDHSLLHLSAASPSRHDQPSPAVVPIRNLLFSDYVKGRLRLGFWGMLVQARAIEKLDDEVIRSSFEHYRREREALGYACSGDELARLQENVLRRKRGCAETFAAFAHNLRLERDEALRIGSTRRAMGERVASAARDHWQRFAILHLHDAAVRPWLKAKRAASNVSAWLSTRGPTSWLTRRRRDP